MPSRTLKAVAALCALHWVVLATAALLSGVGAYAIGQLVWKLVYVAIVIYAVLRIARYGWGVSVFILVATLASETRSILAAREFVGSIDWLLFGAVNVPLVVALCLLLTESSRQPFRRAPEDSRAAA